MKAWFLAFSLIFGIFFATIYSSSKVDAESLSVSLRVGDTRISFDGYSSPNAFITVKQNSIVIGTTIADSSGNWSKIIDAYNPGIQSFELYATDSNNLQTTTITYNVNLLANTLTTISNIVFSPTVTTGVLPTSTSATLTYSGTTNPLASLTLLISDGNTYPIIPAPDGTWSIIITVSNIPGTYTSYVTATMPGSYISLASETITFTLTSTPSSSPTTSSSPSTSSSTPSPFTSPSPTSTSTPSSKKITPTPTTKPVDISEILTPIQALYTTIARPLLNINIVLIVLATLASVRTIIYFFIIFRKKKSKKRKYN